MAKILVLDNVADAVAFIQNILSRKGHEVAGFTDEEPAIDHAASHPVDLLILEIKLKKLSGIEVLEEIKKRNPAVRAIILTRYPTLKTAREALKLGALLFPVTHVVSGRFVQDYFDFLMQSEDKQR